jgi:hypothetical protein
VRRVPSGLTNLMRNIRVPSPEFVVEHTNPAGWDRRHVRVKPTGKRRRRAVVLPARNEPYVNPDKDRTLAGKARVRGRRQLGRPE